MIRIGSRAESGAGSEDSDEVAAVGEIVRRERVGMCGKERSWSTISEWRVELLESLGSRAGVSELTVDVAKKDLPSSSR